MRRRGVILLVSCLAVSVAPAGAAQRAPAWVDPYVSGAAGRSSAFVHTTTPARLDEVMAAAPSLGIQTGTAYGAIGVFVAYGTPQAFTRLARNPAVAAVEGNRPVSFLTDSSHKATGSQALLDGDPTLADGTAIDGAGIGVAIVDSGIDGTHPDLDDRVVSNVKIICPSHPTSVYIQPFTRPDECLAGAKQTIPMEDTDTPSAGGHGTHVSGIVAGTGEASNGRFHGAAPGASLFGVSIGTAVTVENAADGLRWVLDNHDLVNPPIRVVNNSWGTATHTRYSTAPDHFHSVVWKLQEALIAEGVTVVQAAGNSGGDGTVGTTTPECVNPTPGVICVANYYDKDTGVRSGPIDGSSSRGNSDPGQVDTWPDIAAPGTNIISTCRDSLPVCALLGSPVEDPDDAYAGMTGTSMAAPHVAGIVAQLLQFDPDLTPAEVEELLEDGAYKFTWGSRYSLVDPSNPDDSISFEKGHGLVDIVAVLRALMFPDEEPAPDPEWPADPPPPVLGEPGPPQRFFFHSTARANGIDQTAGTATFSPAAPAPGGAAVATEEWFDLSGEDPAWTGTVEGPLQSVKVDFWVKSTDESTHDVGVPPIFHVRLQVGSEVYRLGSFSPSVSAIDSVPRRITREFRHYLVPDGPDEGTAEDLEFMDIDTMSEPVTISIGADWFHHAGAIVYDSTEYPSGFAANLVDPPSCAAPDESAATPQQLFFRSTTRNGNLDAAAGLSTLDVAAPTAGDDARMEDVVFLRNPVPATAFDPIWRGAALDGNLCSITLDFWQKQTLDEAILNQVNYLVKVWVGDAAYTLPNLVEPGSATSDVTRVTHTFTTMMDAFGNEVPMLIDASSGPIAFEVAGRYVDADIQTSVFYDSTIHPSSIAINGAS